MNATVSEIKSSLRNRVRVEQKKISTEQRSAASVQARTLLQAQPTWQRAVSILLYAPMRYELDLTPLFADGSRVGKRMAVPRFDPPSRRYVSARIESLTELSALSFGIPEPAAAAAVVPIRELDLVLVPGIAFDLRGHRLGRGRGHYDQLLAEFRGVKCGVAFDAQIVDEIPVEAHDVLMDYVLTPTRWLTCDRATA